MFFCYFCLFLIFFCYSNEKSLSTHLESKVYFAFMFYTHVIPPGGGGAVFATDPTERFVDLAFLVGVSSAKKVSIGLRIMFFNYSQLNMARSSTLLFAAYHYTTMCLFHI